MFYILYKTTNNIDGKTYVGCHKTNDLEDGYFGSGKLIKRAIAKYGLENFERKVLAQFDNKDDVYQMESILVDQDFIDSPETYNLKLGGEGGFDYINEQNLNAGRGLATKDKAAQASKSRKAYLQQNPKAVAHMLEIAAAGRKVVKAKYNFATFKGKAHTEETKAQMSKSHKANRNSQGSRNSQFGTMWITDGNQSKKVKKDTPIPEGWNKGRHKE